MNSDQIVVDEFINKQPFLAAKVLEGFNADETAEFLVELPPEQSLRLLELMTTAKAARCLLYLPREYATKLLEQSEISFAESLCRVVDPTLLEDLLSGLSENRAGLLRQKLQQAANAVGVMMVPAIVANKEMTVKDAVSILKRNKDNLESFLYVVNLDGTFEGAVRLKELLWADRKMTLEELIIRQIPTFLPETPIKEVIRHPAWYEYRYIPVVDKSEKLLGTLPYQTTRELSDDKERSSSESIFETGRALGELYLIGITGLLQSVGK